MGRRLLTASIAATLLLAPAARAADPLAGGTTRLKPAKAVSVALVSRGVTIEQSTFTISGGALTSGRASGVIEHEGGLTFRGAQASLAATGLRIRLAERSTLTGTVSGIRVRLLRLDLSAAKVTRRGLDTRISGIAGRLTPVAAGALNRTFATARFKPGMRLGTLSVRAKPASVALTRGRSLLALDPNLAAGLQALEIELRLERLKVAGGRLDAAGSTGSIGHTGGLEFRRGDTRLPLTQVVVRLSKRPRILARFGDKRLTFANLDPAALKPVLEGRRFTLAGLPLVLTTSAAKTLNQAFGTTAFATGMPFGVLSIRATAA